MYTLFSYDQAYALFTIYLDWLLAAEASAKIEFLSIFIFTLEAISSTI